MGQLKLSRLMLFNSLFLTQKLHNTEESYDILISCKLCAIHGHGRNGTKLAKMGELKLLGLIRNNT